MPPPFRRPVPSKNPFAFPAVPLRNAVTARAERASVLCGKYSSTCRRVLKYSPQSTIRNAARRSSADMETAPRMPPTETPRLHNHTFGISKNKNPRHTPCTRLPRTEDKAYRRNRQKCTDEPTAPSNRNIKSLHKEMRKSPLNPVFLYVIKS